MAQEPRWAPYAPPATLVQTINHYRARDVPERITKSALTQIISEGLVSRVWAGLRHLGLIEEDGLTSDKFRALRLAAGDDEYHRVLLGILQQAYSDIFAVLDPATATDQQLQRAFIPYSPGAQRERMITLFLGLCREAGIDVAVSPKQRPTQTQQGETTRAKVTSTRRMPARSPARRSGALSEDAALAAWFDNRPVVGTVWRTADRERWNKTLMAIIDGLYELEGQAAFDAIVDEVHAKPDEDERAAAVDNAGRRSRHPNDK